MEGLQFGLQTLLLRRLHPTYFTLGSKNITYEAKPGAAVHASVPQAVDRHHDKHLS